jgi:bifunctional ADP-heptose synthase (sugar kinase/adenylyltransferase)
LVKGEGKRNHTDAIQREEEAIAAVGGQLVLTDEDTFSASTLINHHLDFLAPEVRAFLNDLVRRYSEARILEYVAAMRSMRILVVGETIIDEYDFCEVMAKANKEPILAARHKRTEKYAGGTLAIANHLASFCENVSLLSVIGEEDSQIDFITSALNSGVHPYFIRKPGSPTIVKHRFVEDHSAIKLFEVYQMRNEHLEPAQEAAICAKLEELVPRFDMVLVADYGHGLLTDKAIGLLCKKARLLAVNAQTNAGNRGFNMISRYPRADFISIDEPEARLETRNQSASLRDVALIIAQRTACKRMLVTQGK